MVKAAMVAGSRGLNSSYKMWISFFLSDELVGGLELGIGFGIGCRCICCVEPQGFAAVRFQCIAGRGRARPQRGLLCCVEPQSIAAVGFPVHRRAGASPAPTWVVVLWSRKILRQFF